MLKNLLIIQILLLSAFVPANFNIQKKASSSLDLTGTIFESHTSEEIKDYYKDISEGEKGDVVLTKLQDILKTGQEKVKYNSGDKSSNAWNGYYLYERNFDLSPITAEELDGNYKKTDIWLNSMYLSTPIYIEDKINSGSYIYKDIEGNEHTGTFKTGEAQFDREHVFVKKYGFNGENSAYEDYTAGCDIQNLHLADHVANSSGHNDLPYGTVENKSESNAIYSLINGEIAGYKGENSSGITVFEPMDRDKGDVARSIFYMAARYHTYEKISDKDESPALTISDNITIDKTTSPSETKDNPAAYGLLTDLLNWNELDPVSDAEKYRNELIFNTDQGNRNPFIDFPHWARACFDDSYPLGVTFNIKTTPHIEVKTGEEFKDTYYFFEEFNPKGIEVNYVDSDDNITSITDFSLEANGHPLTENFMFFGRGELTFKAKAIIDGQEFISKNSITITYKASEAQLGIIIIIGIIALILALIIYFIHSHHKKENKKYKKIENRIVKLKSIDAVNDATSKKSKKKKKK